MCKFCNIDHNVVTNNPIWEKDENNYATIDKDAKNSPVIEVNYEGIYVDGCTIPIKFCPMCGRDLTII